MLCVRLDSGSTMYVVFHWRMRVPVHTNENECSMSIVAFVQYAVECFEIYVGRVVLGMGYVTQYTLCHMGFNFSIFCGFSCVFTYTREAAEKLSRLFLLILRALQPCDTMYIMSHGTPSQHVHTDDEQMNDMMFPDVFPMQKNSGKRPTKVIPNKTI